MELITSFYRAESLMKDVARVVMETDPRTSGLVEGEDWQFVLVSPECGESLMKVDLRVRGLANSERARVADIIFFTAHAFDMLTPGASFIDEAEGVSLSGEPLKALRRIQLGAMERLRATLTSEPIS